MRNTEDVWVSQVGIRVCDGTTDVFYGWDGDGASGIDERCSGHTRTWTPREAAP